MSLTQVRLYSEAMDKLQKQHLARAAQLNALAINATKGSKDAARELNRIAQ